MQAVRTIEYSPANRPPIHGLISAEIPKILYTGERQMAFPGLIILFNGWLFKINLIEHSGCLLSFHVWKKYIVHIEKWINSMLFKGNDFFKFIRDFPDSPPFFKQILDNFTPVAML